MVEKGVVAAGGRLTDWISLGVLASSVPRDAVDDAIAAVGKQAKRPDGKLPPHVVVYLVMALALFADDDYEEAAERVTETLTGWGCWDDSWSVPTSGGITQARKRLGYEPLRELFSEVAVPVAGVLPERAHHPATAVYLRPGVARGRQDDQADAWRHRQRRRPGRDQRRLPGTPARPRRASRTAHGAVAGSRFRPGPSRICPGPRRREHLREPGVGGSG